MKKLLSSALGRKSVRLPGDLASADAACSGWAV